MWPDPIDRSDAPCEPRLVLGPPIPGKRNSCEDVERRVGTVGVAPLAPVGDGDDGIRSLDEGRDRQRACRPWLPHAKARVRENTWTIFPGSTEGYDAGGESMSSQTTSSSENQSATRVAFGAHDGRGQPSRSSRRPQRSSSAAATSACAVARASTPAVSGRPPVVHA